MTHHRVHGKCEVERNLYYIQSNMCFFNVVVVGRVCDYKLLTVCIKIE